MNNKKQTKDNSIIIRTERQYLKSKDKFDQLCWYSKNLYNLTNYYIRQAFILGQKDDLELTEKDKEILNKINIKIQEYNKTLNKKMPFINKNNYCINNYSFLDFTIRNLKNEEFPEGETNPYKQLPSGVSQQIIKNLCENWKGYLAALKDWKKNPDKYTGKPKMPNYKDKKDGRHILYFASNAFNHKDNKIFLAKKVIGYEYKTNAKGKVQQVRILPRKEHYIIETVYKYNNNPIFIEKLRNNKMQRYIAIDIGINNILTVVNNIGERPFIINGKPIKSINKYYNKLKAKAMSYVGGRGTSKRTRMLDRKRNNKMNTIIHRISRYIVRYCEEHNIDVIVIGKNKGWKQNSDMGKINNQTFVQIPFAKLIEKIKYKAEEKGIIVITKEESYTSKCDALALEPIKKHKKYLGKRKKRGLFQSSIGRLINADVNGALNILRKEIGDEFIKEIIKNKIDLTPYKITIV